jgi:hypothetical protein
MPPVARAEGEERSAALQLLSPRPTTVGAADMEAPVHPVQMASPETPADAQQPLLVPHNSTTVCCTEGRAVEEANRLGSAWRAEAVAEGKVARIFLATKEVTAETAALEGLVGTAVSAALVETGEAAGAGLN